MILNCTTLCSINSRGMKQLFTSQIYFSFIQPPEELLVIALPTYFVYYIRKPECAELYLTFGSYYFYKL